MTAPRCAPGAEGRAPLSPVRTAAEAAKASARPMAALCLAASVLSLLFVLSYGYALHAPRPHGVRIDAVAPAAGVSALQQGLDRAEPGGFRLHRVSTPSGARRDVRDGRAFGALVEGSTGDELVTASASGVSLRQVVTTALTAAATAQGVAVHDHDVRPLPPGDRAGQSAFVFEVGLLIPGVLGSVGFYLAGRRVRSWVRVAAAAGYAVLASVLAVLVLDTWLGALTGSPWMLLATGVLAAAAFVLTIAACHTVLGLPGTAVGVGTLLVVGNAANGSTVAVPMLPDGYRQLAPWLPNAAAVHAVRADVYFAGHGQGQPVLALALWVAGAVLVLVAGDIVHLRARRRRPGQHEQIHATPVVVQLRAHHVARSRVAHPVGAALSCRARAQSSAPRAGR